MNRFIGLSMIAGGALAASAAVRMIRKHWAVAPQSPTQSEIDRFENEGGHAVPI